MYNGLKRVHIIVFSCGGALPVCGLSLAYPSVPPVSFSPGLSQRVHSPFSLLFLCLSSAAFNYLSSSSISLALGLVTLRVWESTGSVPTFLPKHSLLPSCIHLDVHLPMFLRFLPAL